MEISLRWPDNKLSVIGRAHDSVDAQDFIRSMHESIPAYRIGLLLIIIRPKVSLTYC